MKYNLKNEIDKQKFKQRSNELFEEGAFTELRKINQSRTPQQNKYLHVILGYFAVNYGDEMSYVKEEMFKKLVNPEIFITEFTNRKTGEVREYVRSTSAIDSGEMTLAIERFRNYSSKEAGIYLAEPHELEMLRHMEIEMEKVKQYI